MKPLDLFILIGLLLVTSCSSDSNVEIPRRSITPDEVAILRSTDKSLEKAFEWARKTALSYSYSGADPVGYWYSAGLPIKEAFCMRDVSHQSVGAQILGLARHNKNMLTHIVSNIADSRDWCSYWEINRYGKPIPADYFNDKEFWYNLTANPDVIQAAFKMYDWTGDKDYIFDPAFTNFYDRTVNDYVVRWELTPDKIMDREPYINAPDNFDPDNKFHVCHGIPSYNESLPGLSLGVDMLAALYRGYEAYSKISAVRGLSAKGKDAHLAAENYKELLESIWWNKSQSRYYSGLMSDGSFVDSEGSLYVVWFGATDNVERIRSTLAEVLASEWDVQYSSYIPEILYSHGYCKEGYDYLINLPAKSTADYPEVAYSFISSCVCGIMGFNPSYSDKHVGTLCRLSNPRDESQIKNIAVYDGYMDVSHIGHTVTEICNNTSVDLTWKASFMGDYDWVEVGTERYRTVKQQDVKGNVVSSVEVKLSANSSLRAQAV